MRSGPARSCDCGDLIDCRTCRRREQVRRSYHRLPPLAPLPRGVASRLRLPQSPTDLAYIAGLFDGEGCITRTNGRVIVQIGMTDRDVIEYLVGLGGTMRVEQPPGNRKPLYRWRVLAGREVAELLDALGPYLRVKRAPAAAALVELLAWCDE